MTTNGNINDVLTAESTELVLITHDKQEVKVRPGLVKNFATIHLYLNAYNVNDVVKFTIPNTAPKMNKEHLDMILRVLELNLECGREEQAAQETGTPNLAVKTLDDAENIPVAMKKTFDYFRQFDCDKLLEAIEAANFTGVNQFVSALNLFLASKISEQLDTDHLVGFFGDEFGAESRERFSLWMKEDADVTEAQRKIDEELARRKAEEEARKEKAEEEERRKAEEEMDREICDDPLAIL